MTRFIHPAQRLVAFNHVHHLYLATGVTTAIHDGGKHRFARAVRFAFGARDGIGIGQVAGDSIEAHGLRRHRRTGDLGNILETHGYPYCPAMALARPLIFIFTNVKLVWKSVAFCENAACSTPISTVLPSRLGW